MKRKFKDNILFQPIKVESCSAFISSLMKTAFDILKMDFNEMPTDIIELADSFGINKTEELLSWKLINRSLMDALTELLKENQNSFELKNVEKFKQSFKYLEYDKNISVDRDFFDNPKGSVFVKDIQSILLQCFREIGIHQEISETITERFPEFFVYSLNREWSRNSEEYKPLLAESETPFSEITIMEDDWERYKAWLEKQTQKSVFAEAFSLSQIYIPLNAYYIESEFRKSINGDVSIINNKVVVDIYENLSEWLRINDKDDCIRLISGSPGSGKSSFAKMFVNSISNRLVNGII